LKVAVVFFAQKKREKMMELAKGLAKGFERQGFQVDIVDAEKDVNSKLTIYSYIALGTDTTSIFKGAVSPKVKEFISGAGMVGGKKSFAFVNQSLMGSSKTLSNLMKIMESEGMFLKFSEILKEGKEAEIIASRLKVK